MTQPPPAELVDDVAGDIFLRLPPDEPEHLFLASLVCKPWLRLLTDPDFLRRYRASHRTPPLLGYLKRCGWQRRRDYDPGLFRTTAVSLAPNPPYREALDCRHGRVLLCAADTDAGDSDWSLLVWDPVTGARTRLPDLGAVIRSTTPHEGFVAVWDPDTGGMKRDPVTGELERHPNLACVERCENGNFAAAVCCAVTGCDHLDCRGGPFRVVFIAGGSRAKVKASVYSSETGAWSAPVTFSSGVSHHAAEPHKFSFQPRRSAIIGEEVCFTVLEDDAIVKYDVRENRLSVIDSPPVQDEYNSNLSIMEMEDGSLGFAYIRRSSLSLHVWSRKLNDAAGEWVLCKVVDLGEKIPTTSNSDHDKAYVAGAAEGLGVVFASTRAGLFTVKVHSGEVKKIGGYDVYGTIVPFLSFYTPDFVDDDVSRWRATERIQKAERQREAEMIEQQERVIAEQEQMVFQMVLSLYASNQAQPSSSQSGRALQAPAANPVIYMLPVSWAPTAAGGFAPPAAGAGGQPQLPWVPLGGQTLMSVGPPYGGQQAWVPIPQPAPQTSASAHNRMLLEDTVNGLPNTIDQGSLNQQQHTQPAE